MLSMFEWGWMISGHCHFCTHMFSKCLPKQHDFCTEKYNLCYYIFNWLEILMAMGCKAERTLNGPTEVWEAANGVSAAVRQVNAMLETPNPVKSRTA